MGKSAKRRHSQQMAYLIRLSYMDPDHFEAACEKRILSWMDDIRRLALAWKTGETDARKTLFDIVDRAMTILLMAALVRKYL